MVRTLLFLLSVAAGLSYSTGSQALILSYTDRTTFETAVTGAGHSLLTETFEGYAGDTAVPSGNTLGAFTYTDNNATGLSFIVHDGAPNTSSGTRWLGLSDGGSDLLVQSDRLTISFAPTHGFGLSLLTEPSVVNGDLLLTIGATTASLTVADLQQTLGDGTREYFLGIFDNVGTFASATIVGSALGTWKWQIDDITVVAAPEPPATTASFFLLSIFPLILAAHWRRRQAGKGVPERPMRTTKD